MVDFVFTARPPRGPLASYVESLWCARGVSEHVDVIFPTAQISLLINLGDPQLITAHERAPFVGAEAWIVGQQRRVITNAPVGRTDVVGATFKSVGAAAVLGVACDALTGQIIDLGALWGAFAGRARRQLGDLGERSTPAARLAMLERLLSTRLADRADCAAPRIHRVRQAFGALTAAEPLPVGRVCELVGLSNRALIADFQRLVGLRPKEVSRQVRLHQLLGALASAAPTSLSELALAHGYCDQAHLNREFRGVAGISPTEYLRRRRSAYGDDPSSPNFVTG